MYVLFSFKALSQPSIVYNLYKCFNKKLKVKSQKILNSEENSKRKVPNQMEKSNDKTH